MTHDVNEHLCNGLNQKLSLRAVQSWPAGQSRSAKPSYYQQYQDNLEQQNTGPSRQARL